VEKAPEIAAAIVDTGVLYALADRKDSWHCRCASYVDGFKGRLIVPSTVIPEACYLIGHHLGADAERAFVKALARGELTIAHITGEDLTRCVDLLLDYRDAAIGFVDASVAAIAERLGVSTILTTDRRHFALLRDARGRAFVLKP
jgi:predicted nucleic acid-binding protein